MHQLQNQEQSIRFHGGQVLAIANNNFGNADLARAAKRLVQDGISFFPTLLRLKEIGPRPIPKKFRAIKS